MVRISGFELCIFKACDVHVSPGINITNTFKPVRLIETLSRGSQKLHTQGDIHRKPSFSWSSMINLSFCVANKSSASFLVWGAISSIAIFIIVTLMTLRFTRSSWVGTGIRPGMIANWIRVGGTWGPYPSYANWWIPKPQHLHTKVNDCKLKVYPNYKNLANPYICGIHVWHIYLHLL